MEGLPRIFNAPVVRWTILTPVSIFETAIEASQNGLDMLGALFNGHKVPVHVQIFKVGKEAKQAGHLLTVPTPTYKVSRNTDKPHLRLVVLNELGKQLYLLHSQ